MSAAAAGPAVVLVGRPNVGKSTLFNRISGTRRAIVTPVAGTTRDVISQPAEWSGVSFTLVDTGGMFGASEDPLHELVVEHGRKALDTADLVVFVVDGREGLVPGDQEIAGALRTRGVPVVVAVNKTDDRRARGRAVEFYQFGFEPVMEVAAEHGQGVGDLLDEVLARLPAGRRARVTPATPEESREIAVAIVGRPNVGKSSLVNRLLREERVMVSAEPGTTRDAVDAVLKWHRQSFRIVDTAGIRRPGRVARAGGVEAVSVLVARRAIERADVAALVIDASEGATDQDGAIAGEAENAGCGIIIAANKWDLMKDRGPDYVKEFDDKLRFQLKFLEYAPILHISARTGERAHRLLETIDHVAEARARRIPTGELNRFVAAVTAVHPPASPGRREVRILYAAQTAVKPPTFVFFTNVATSFHFSYERFLLNRLRESFGLTGTPIRLIVRRRTKKT
ncbi:MAG TPA: ribosome biogenesis GTPase Der [Vicinamibacterales bacterium]|jgi:GTP-binding protein|nr:ribosome biogenesis GTPase Der [Vicinamibacterales bacterium]